MTEDEAKQAVIDAALEWYEGHSGSDLSRAVEAYRKASAPPKPFETYVGQTEGGMVSDPTRRADLVNQAWSKVWRCTVTPTERVQ